MAGWGAEWARARRRGFPGTPTFSVRASPLPRPVTQKRSLFLLLGRSGLVGAASFGEGLRSGAGQGRTGRTQPDPTGLGPTRTTRGPPLWGAWGTGPCTQWGPELRAGLGARRSTLGAGRAPACPLPAARRAETAPSHRVQSSWRKSRARIPAAALGLQRPPARLSRPGWSPLVRLEDAVHQLQTPGRKAKREVGAQGVRRVQGEVVGL